MRQPVHPSGFPRADDAPAFIAPALDLRVAAIEGLDLAGDAVDRAVAFTLSFPIVEAPRTLAPPPYVPPAGDYDADATLVDLPRVDSSERTVEGDYYRSGETTLAETDRDGLVRTLPMLGPFDGLPDLDTDRTTEQRVFLGRARAIRFRIAMMDAHPHEGALDDLPDGADLALHVATVVALADGLPGHEVSGRSPADAAVVQALDADVRGRFPDLSPVTVREAGAAAFARITLLGTRRGAAYIGSRWEDSPVADRRAALTLARRIVGDDTGHRSIAMQLLREALHV